MALVDLVDLVDLGLGRQVAQVVQVQAQELLLPQPHCHSSPRRLPVTT